MRSIESIESSYVARFEPRATGRTTKMILSLPSADEIEDKLYIVGLHLCVARQIIRDIEKLRGTDLANKCVPVSSDQAFFFLSGRDPFSVYIDHTALEHARLKDIQYLYSILDRQNIFN